MSLHSDKMGNPRAAESDRVQAHGVRGYPWTERYGQQRFVCDTCGRNLPETEFLTAAIGPARAQLGTAAYLYPDCRGCLAEAKRTLPKHPLWTPDLGIAAKAAIARARYGAKKRKLVVVITLYDVISLFYKQNGLCALSGVPMTFDKSREGAKRANRCAMSIDRIDSSESYMRKNIQLVCWSINAMKGNMSEDELRFWCAQVVLHNAEDEDED